ncbi:folylpolyglutamate synthase, mitochondrial-like isoform X1 [Daphnia carinata]|uniref:folylpolyglutamate synthase, mitochondrial-like isoform X1 n=1 Tax=Daphnia carinata TaxID=120202 RepID=UPI0028683B2D|nr:folylpolyglutamate synthase, mitochondrial-like isoform X1 [Daphnia carinata]
MHVLFTYSVKRLNFSILHALKPFSKTKFLTMDYADLKTFSCYKENNYEAAVETLNSLQSNASVLEKARLQKDRQAITNVPFTEKYLNRLGISLDKIDQQLKIIHVSGTKGKGSTCAFCESILRHHGLKTGFYSSPHLIEVRERIRINGKPLSKEEFARYFWEVYNPLKNYMDDEHDMPAYFKFMTIMAFYVFLNEEVEVAVFEVGIGGLYDCTNVIRKPVVVGITSLGLDHVSLLGNTVEKIAFHKAGIMKPSVPTYTVSDQPGESLHILAEKALEIKCPLYIVPSLDEYHWAPYQINLGLSGKVQRKNASLALQLSRAFLNPKIESGPAEQEKFIFPVRALPFQIHLPDALGLAQTFWPGRSQILRLKGATFYVDGAHTPESIEACVEWFLHATSSNRSRRKRVLMFNTTGDRNASLLLAPLIRCQFDVAIFCSNIICIDNESASKDLLNLMVTKDQQVRRSNVNSDAWLENGFRSNGTSSQKQIVVALPTISSALDYVNTELVDNETGELDVLVTGSLHLVGGVLSLLDTDHNFLQVGKTN